MNASIITTPSQCFWGSCSYLDLSTCMQINRQENITTQPITTDIEGCFNTNQLRSTADYHQYKLVRMQHSTHILDHRDQQATFIICLLVLPCDGSSHHYYRVSWAGWKSCQHSGSSLVGHEELLQPPPRHSQYL